MNILVTGATGFVGQKLVPALIDHGHCVSIIHRDENKKKFGAKVIEYDLHALKDISDKLANIDVVIHLAGRAHVMHETVDDIYQAYASVNIDYTLKVAELSQRLGIKRFIFLSSIKVNGETSVHPFTESDAPAPSDAYGQTKLEAELALKKFCDKHQIELVIIRPPLIYGTGVKANFKQLIKLCVLPVPLPFASVRSKRSFICLENLVDFIILCSWHPEAANQTFLVSDGEDISIAELIKTIRQANKQKTWLTPMHPKLLEMFFKIIGKSGLAQRLLGALQVDITKAKILLGWQPKIGCKEGIARTLKE